MGLFKDHTGQTFGDWNVLERGQNSKQGQANWICQCGLCKKLVSVRGTHLRSGHSTKCKLCHDSTFNRRHGMHNAPVYGVWEAMIGRCHNPRNKNFFNYGGRGIFVCDEWRKDFVIFFKDMGEPPEKKTLDRINNDSGYCKQNCQWRSRQEQLSNTRTSHKNGTIYGTWKLLDNIPFSTKGVFECIHCKEQRTCDISYITSGRVANHKCRKERSHSSHFVAQCKAALH